MLQVDGAAGVQKMTHEHLAIALVLAVPLIIVITKADVTPADTMAATIVSSVKCMCDDQSIPTVCFISHCTAITMFLRDQRALRAKSL
jgi:GTPase